MIKFICEAVIILCFTLTSSFTYGQDSTRFINLGLIYPMDVSPYGRVVVGDGKIWTKEGGIQSMGSYPDGSIGSAYIRVSDNDSIISGNIDLYNSQGNLGFRWVGGSFTTLPPLYIIPNAGWVYSRARGISGDGTIIVGESISPITFDDNNLTEATQWIGGQAQGLGVGPGGNGYGSKAWAISHDGSAIVGTYTPDENNDINRAFIIVSSTGMQSLGEFDFIPYSVSDSGKVIVGGYHPPVGEELAARWTISGGLETLQGAVGFSRAFDVSADGSIIVGLMQNKPFIWDEETGVRDLKTVLETEYQLDLTGWELGSCSVDSSGTVLAGVGTYNGMTRGWLAQLIKYPVFIVPGIAGTYADDTANDLAWIMNRGVPPALLQIDPLGKVYHDIIKTFENVGYKKDEDLFVVNYDWRLTPGPNDTNLNGHIEGLTGTAITDAQFNYGVDYLGWYIKKACEKWREKYHKKLDSIDVIAHSTGGLVTRTYIQSNSYGDVYDPTNNYRLPTIRNFVMMGVPNRGASKAWNAIHDNWIADPIYRFVLSKILNSAYQKILRGGTVNGPDYDITFSSIQDSLGNPSKIMFINQYVPTLRGLLATYDFINFGNGYTNVNNDTDQRNSFVLDLNNGYDLYPNTDPNGFLDAAKVSVVYGTGQSTFDLVEQRDDFEFNASQSFTDWAPRNALPGTIWYKDISSSGANGDGTVPITSSAGQFLNDSRAVRYPFSVGDHTSMVSNVEVQSKVLDILHVDYEQNNVSTGASPGIRDVLNVIVDPVESILTDGDGNRLGYSNSTGPLAEIPNSIWFGNTDGRGWVFGSVQEPINLQLTGLGEDYYVMVSVEDSGYGGGVVLEGSLGLGEVINYQITLNPLAVEQLTLTADDYTLAQNYPNPFNPTTKISYSIPDRSNVTLKVYDILGNEIAELVNEEKGTGVYSVSFDASSLASGIYLYRLQAGSFIETKKMVLIR